MAEVPFDVEWAKKVLLDFAQVAREASRENYPGNQWLDPSPTTDRLRVLEAKTARVVQTIMGLDAEPELIKGDGYGNLEVRTGSDLALKALGLLESEAEIEAHLPKSNAPAMSADELHPLIWQAARGLWNDGHYREAVAKAATFLSAEVLSKVRRTDLNDRALMSQAFSADEPTPDKPRLRWTGSESDQTVKAMRDGILLFSQGVFLAIRNPATHSTVDFPRQVALEQLATLSTLARWIDECVLVEA